MTWQRLPLCFGLVSPLHLGLLPNRPGTVVAPTRCYVPGRNLWAAVTACVTPRLHPDPTADSFRRVGELIQEHVRFSYFYLSDGVHVFDPDYQGDLCWGGLREQAFRARFTDSLVSTALADGGSAEDQSLHEIEFIRHRVGSPGAPARQVLLIGVAWIREGSRVQQQGDTMFLDEFDLCDELVLGGEQNYGFGRLRRAPVPDSCRVVLNWWPSDPEASLALHPSRPLLAHAPYRRDLVFKGDIEILAGREYRRDATGPGFLRPGAQIINIGYHFTPGTRLKGNAAEARLDPWGRFVWAEQRRD